MAVTHAHASRHIGRPVCATCHDGSRHYGIVQRVTSDGIWMQRIPGPTGGITPVAGKGNGKGNAKVLNLHTADRPNQTDAEQVFWPFFFLPFLTLAALSPFAWGGWGGWGGWGYPYFW